MNRVRRTVLFVLRYTGLLGLWRYWHRHQIAILTLHGVMDDLDGPSWRPLRPRMSRALLARYMQVLSRHYRFISMDEAVKMLSGRAPAAPYSAVLTFDDGCRNNLTHAMPILRRYGAPAVFFVPTSHIHRRRPFWFDRLDYALQQADVDGREVRVAGRSVRLAGGGREALAGSYARLRQLAKAVTPSDWEFRDEMDGLASELEAQSGCALADIYEQDDWSAVLTAEEIRSAAGGDVTFGSHTADHVRLGLVNEDVTREQLLSSKRAMEELTSRPCVHFCYPNGSYNSRTPSLVRECGYACAVTSNEGLNRPGDDMMLLRRVNLPSGCVSDTELLVRVSGLSAALRELKSHLARRLSRRRREGGAVRMGPPSAEAQRRPSE